MEYRKVLGLFLSASVLLSLFHSATVFAAIPDRAEKGTTIVSNQHVPKMVQIGKFKEKYGNGWKLDWDEKTDTPRRIYGYGIDLKRVQPKSGILPIEPGNTGSAVRNFISSNKDLLKVDVSDLKLRRAESDRPVWQNGSGETFYAFYDQYYRGIPVYGGSLGIVAIDDKIVSIASDVYPDITIRPTPGISETDVLKSIQEELKTGDAVTPTNVSLVIFPRGTGAGFDYRLAYKVDLPLIKRPFGAWTFFVDANTGGVLHRYNKVVYDAVAGTVTGMIYPEYPSQAQQNAFFKNGNVTLKRDANNSMFHSGHGNNLGNYMKTSTRIDLSGKTWANLTLSTKYDMEQDYDYLHVQVSADGTNWNTLASYTGAQPSPATKSMNLSGYIGEQIYLRFNYTTDPGVVNEGFYADNVSVVTNAGTAFFDDGESGSGKWVLSGFSMAKEYATLSSTPTDGNGHYELTGNGNVTVYAELKGPNVRVVNFDRLMANHTYDAGVPGTHDWNWTNDDGSDRDEESNVFYHVNEVHDFFTKGSPFNITSMNYQMSATVEYGDAYCNAFYDGDTAGIYFGGGNLPTCENLALGSDVIYHEYTHAVVDRIYTTPFPYEGQTGAMNEGWADYFAATINDNPLIGEGIIPPTSAPSTTPSDIRMTGSAKCTTTAAYFPAPCGTCAPFWGPISPTIWS